MPVAGRVESSALDAGSKSTLMTMYSHCWIFSNRVFGSMGNLRPIETRDEQLILAAVLLDADERIQTRAF